MPIHAQLSPETQSRLRRQKRATTISSVIIALLGLILVGLILLLISLRLVSQDVPLIVGYQATSKTDEELETRKVQTTTQRKPSSPSQSMSKVIASAATSSVAIPVPDFPVEEPSVDFGSTEGFGSGWGDGSGFGAGGGGGFAGIPSTMQKRCTLQDRLERLKANGGNEACEEAVVQGLRFLAKTQNTDGSWGSNERTAWTGLALLAFLGHCETTNSKEFGKNVLGAIVYLTDVALKNEGRLTHDASNRYWPYEHSIATYALAEAYSLCVLAFKENLPELDTAVELSTQFIIDNQHPSGGWDYSYDVSSKRGGDSSISGWHLQALKAAKLTELDFKGLNAAAREGLAYFETLQTEDGAVGYTSKNGAAKRYYRGFTLTAVGALCYQMWDKPKASFTRKAVRYLDEVIDFEWNGESADLYGHYYATQALINKGGTAWTSYNAKFRDEVLNNQNADGSFPNVANAKANPKIKGKSSNSVHYRTCLAILMLECYYRFLPASN